ncbi:MAG TPA: right-handed parallel beta-helix repeat-containing protein [bacterium]|nr:right-handed parallel beta-helix repeat-containing protein [bacterium]
MKFYLVQKRIAVILLLLGFFFVTVNQTELQASASDSLDIFVATNGNDSSSGDIAHPLATLEGARNKIRALTSRTKPINVFLRGGTYRLDKAFSLTADDSGSETSLISYRSYPGEKVDILGSKQLSPSWSDYTITDYKGREHGIKKAVLAGPEWNFSSLFLGEERLTRARIPNINDSPYWLNPEGVSKERATKEFFYAKQGDINPNWKNFSEVQLDLLMSSYRQAKQYIKSVRTVEVQATRLVTVDEVTIGGVISDNLTLEGLSNYFIDNVFEGLDSPGEWYLDKETKELFYYPRESEDFSRLEVPVIETLLSAKGTYSDLGLSKGSFTFSAWVNPESPGKVFVDNGTAGNYKISFNSNQIAVPYKEERGGCGSGKFALNRWSHVAVSYDLSTKEIRCYVNGEFSGTVTQSYEPPALPDPSPPVLAPHYNSVGYTGGIDDFVVLDRAANADEIFKMYQGIDIDGALISLRFDNNLKDSSGKNNDGWSFDEEKLNYINRTDQNRAVYLDSNVTDSIKFANGVATRKVKNVSFSGLNFKYSDWALLEVGYGGKVFGSMVQTRAMIDLAATENVSFSNNSFSNTSFYALNDEYSKDLEIAGNTFDNLGGGGMKIGTMPLKFYRNKYIDGYKVLGNTIRNGGKIYSGSGVGIALGTGSGNLLQANNIYNMPYSGIGFSQALTDPAERMIGGTIIENNTIHDVMQVLNDGGGIYLNGDQPGTEIRKNVVYNVGPKDAWRIEPGAVVGIYLDAGSKNIKVYDNLVFNTGISLSLGEKSINNLLSNNVFVHTRQSSGITFYPIGKENRVENNIFVSTFDYISYNAKIERDHPGDTVADAAKREGMKLAPIEMNSTKVNGEYEWKSFMDKNVFYAPKANLDTFIRLGSGGRTLKSFSWWQGEETANDRNSVVADPRFVNLANNNYCLNSDSPAKALGIKDVSYCKDGIIPKDVFFTKQVDKVLVKTGDTLTYTLTLYNARAEQLKEVEISDTLSESVEYVSGSASRGGVLSGNRLTWGNLPELKSAGVVSVNFKVKVK